MVGLSPRALMDIHARLPQQYDDLPGSGQKPGSKRVGLPCCAITARYLSNVGAWEGTLLLVEPRRSQLSCAFAFLCPLARAGWYGTPSSKTTVGS
jgi:hypothetical protein